MNDDLSKVLKRLHYPLEVMLTCVRWYAAYPLSLRHIEEMMEERSVVADHTTVHHWALKSYCRFWPAFPETKTSCWSKLADG